MAPDAPLKLRAEDAEDLAVISAVAQDALVAVADMTYDRTARIFTVVANRFRWENGAQAAANSEAGFERTHCALSFAEVERVSYRGFRRGADGRILSLLAIRPAEKAIELEFSGGAAVRLGVTAIRVHVTDIGEPWPTAWQPDHDAPGHDAPGHDAPGHDAPGHDAPGHDAPGHDATGNESGNAP